MSGPSPFPGRDPRLVVGLDVATVAQAERLAAELKDMAGMFKIGLQLALAGGLELARDMSRDGLSIFLDMKLLDIDNTVSGAVESALRIGVSMLTIHAYPKAMRAAVSAARGTDLTLLAVTVLTSMDDADLHDAGYREASAALVERRVGQALAAGMGGIVCAPTEAKGVRAQVGPGMAVVTPGIRLAGDAAGDQKRIMTPCQALAAGASHLVVARPIVAASSPAQAARAILSDMAAARGSA